MSIHTIIFYVLAIFILTSGMMAVTARQIFRSAIHLLFCMIGIAGLYFWMQYEFIAAVQIVVYVGGIVVLIIFSIFLTQKVGKDLPVPNRRREIFAGLASILAFALFWLVIRKNDFYPSAEPGGQLSVNAIGEQMLNYNHGGYVLPFEVVSMLLLAAMIGCIVIALKSNPESNV